MNVEVAYDGQEFSLPLHNLDSHVISTGSHGNAVLLNVGVDYDEYILMDCGVPFKSLKDYAHNIRTICITHRHGDHVKATTLKKLLKKFPYINLICTVDIYDEYGIEHKNVHFIEDHEPIVINESITITPIEGVHSVPVFGFDLCINDINVFYSTDNSNWDSFYNPNKLYDLMIVEANYDANTIQNLYDEIIEKMADETLEVAEHYKLKSRLTRLDSSYNHSSFQDSRQFYTDMIKDDGRVMLAHVSKDFSGGLHEFIQG